MKRQVVLYLGMSLDGYLADLHGGVDWMVGENPGDLGDLGYAQLLQQVDTILMGGTTYRQVTEELSPGEWPYPGLHCHVFTHREAVNQEGITFHCGDAGEVVRELLARPGKDIWVCGGADLAGQLLQKGLIDRFQISILPVLLGGGIPLFQGGFSTIPLALAETKAENGIFKLTYLRRGNAPQTKPME